MHEPWGGPALAVAGLLRRVALLGRSRHLVCAELATGGPRALYIGEGESLPWLARLHGGGRAEPWPFPLSGLSRPPVERGAVLYVEVNRLLARLLPAGGFATLPWLRQVIDLEGALHRGKLKSVEATFGRKVRKAGFGYRLAPGLEAVDECYRGFYLPYVTWRFGALAHPRSLEDLRAAARQGFVLQVYQEGRWVAAAVCRHRRDRVTVAAFGLRGDYENQLRRGALSATYYWLIRWAGGRAVRYIDLLRSRPHEQDGVYEHKSRFGAEPRLDPWPHAGLWIFPPEGAPLSPEGGGFLVKERGGGLVPLRMTRKAGPRGFEAPCG